MIFITPARERFLKENFFQLSFDQKEPDFELFKTLGSADQFFIALDHNWDDGPALLHWIIDSPVCDKGTASVIFWSAVPDYSLDRSPDKLDEEGKDIYELLQKIIRKFRNKEFKRGWLSFDPKNEIENFDGDLNALPKELTRPTPGFGPVRLSVIFHYLSQLKKQFSAKQRARNKRKKTRNRN